MIEAQKHGSVHEYLLHLHKNGHEPVVAFWWGQQRVVSICSPEAFKDALKLTKKPSQWHMKLCVCVCDMRATSLHIVG